MASGAALNTCVFLFAFASMFLLGGKRPLLALSTRLLLVILLGLGLAYLADETSPYRYVLGSATLVANGLFIAFAAIDFNAWQRKRRSGRE